MLYRHINCWKKKKTGDQQSRTSRIGADSGRSKKEEQSLTHFIPTGKAWGSKGGGGKRRDGLALGGAARVIEPTKGSSMLTLLTPVRGQHMGGKGGTRRAERDKT